jgi:hypothetical protein
MISSREYYLSKSFLRFDVVMEPKKCRTVKKITSINFSLARTNVDARRIPSKIKIFRIKYGDKTLAFSRTEWGKNVHAIVDIMLRVCSSIEAMKTILIIYLGGVIFYWVFCMYHLCVRRWLVKPIGARNSLWQ